MKVLIAYLVALLVALSVMFLSKSWDSLLWRIAVADVLATIVVFGFSYYYKNSSMYDPYWSVAPAFIALWYFCTAPEGADWWRNVLVLSAVMLYAVRLTYNWWRSWGGMEHQDWRYVDLQEKHGRNYWLISFLGIHFFPTVLVYLGCLPLYIAIANPDKPFNFLDVVGLAVTIGAVVLAYMADEQMYRFRKNPENTGKVNTEGLWKYSRHPNYVGETLFWVGLYISGFAASTSDWHWTAIGWISMYLLFRFISIPMMEKRSVQRRPDYEEATKDIPVYFGGWKLWK